MEMREMLDKLRTYLQVSRFLWGPTDAQKSPFYSVSLGVFSWCDWQARCSLSLKAQEVTRIILECRRTNSYVEIGIESHALKVDYSALLLLLCKWFWKYLRVLLKTGFPGVCFLFGEILRISPRLSKSPKVSQKDLIQRNYLIRRRKKRKRKRKPGIRENPHRISGFLIINQTCVCF